MPRNALAPNSTGDLPLFAPRDSESSSPVSQQRDRILATVEKKAGHDFRIRAGFFVLSFLQASGPATGEQITDAAKAAGIAPHDDRAFGPVLMRLSRGGLIEKCGFAERKKGHGSAGANLWRAVPR